MSPHWIWLPPTPGCSSGTVAHLSRFRTEFETPTGGIDALPLSITADSRYRLFVNGELVAAGPVKPTASAWFVDTVDLAPLVRPGTNVIGIEVLAYSTSAMGNISIRRSGTPGLWVEGGRPGAVDFANEQAWRCSPAPGRTFLQGVNTLFLGIQERVDATLEPGPWLSAGFDDSDWLVPVEISRTAEDPALVTEPRPIPPMTLTSIAITGVSRCRGVDPGWVRLLDQESVTIEPHQRTEVDLDLGTLTTAFVRVELTGGAGSRIELTAAECYEGAPLEVPWVRVKGDRSDAENGDLHGDPDVYRVAGWGESEVPEVFAPFWFRTARYLRVVVEAGAAPLTLQRLTLTETHYPLAVTGTFRSSSELDRRLWDTSVRTLRNCMHETFEDCPFYEQMQYAMDTRSQALFSLHLSTDDRLIRRAITDFALSGDPEGLTESRAPSIRPQIIPGFSLFWIFMVAEHLDYVGDRHFTSRFLRRMSAVLDYFHASIAEDGFFLSPPETPEGEGRVEMWNFVDWTDAWWATRGVPALGARGANTIVTFQYVAGLACAERTARACGELELAAECQTRAADVLARLGSSSAWDPDARYFRDSDTGVPASQHAQVWAVLAGVVTGEDARDLLSRAVRDPNLAPCSYAMSHSLFEAVRWAGAHDLVDWTPWQEMLNLNLTTWAEDAVSERSDCHAWGSVPLQHFPRWILGVSPGSPGFETTRIDPSPSDRDFADGIVPTPYGPIHVSWHQAEPGVLSVIARLPAAIDLILSDRSTDFDRSIHGGEQTVTFRHVVGALAATGPRGEAAV